MDVVDIVRICLQRWRIVVPLMLVSVAAAITVALQTPAAYEATGSVLLSTDDSAIADERPTALLDPVALTGRLMGESDELEAAGAVADYRVTTSADRSLLIVTATHEDSTVAEQTASVVAQRTKALVQALQDEAEVPDDERLRLQDLGQDQSAVEGAEEGTIEWTATVTVGVTDPYAGVVNPWPASSGTIRVLQEVVMAAPQRATIAARGGSDEFSIEQQTRDPAPIFYIIATSDQATVAVDTYDLVLAEFNAELEQRQQEAGVPSTAWVRGVPLAPPLGAVDVSNPVSKPAVAVLALGGMLTIGLALGIDYVLKRRQDGERDPERDPERDSERDPERDDERDGELESLLLPGAADLDPADVRVGDPSRAG